jgi:hypothetical protein
MSKIEVETVPGHQLFPTHAEAVKWAKMALGQTAREPHDFITTELAPTRNGRLPGGWIWESFGRAKARVAGGREWRKFLASGAV